MVMVPIFLMIPTGFSRLGSRTAGFSEAITISKCTRPGHSPDRMYGSKRTSLMNCGKRARHCGAPRIGRETGFQDCSMTRFLLFPSPGEVILPSCLLFLWLDDDGTRCI